MSDPQTRTPGQLKVSELKEELKKRGITPKGLKRDLVEKLEEVLRKEAEEHFSNTSSDYLFQQVPDGSNSPVRGSSGSNSPIRGSSDVDSSALRSSSYYSPLPVADSTQGYGALPSVTDTGNEGSYSLLQVADSKDAHFISNQQVEDHANYGDFGSKDAEIKGQESDYMLQAGNESALEPEQRECDNQKEENLEHVDSAKISPRGLVSGSEHLCHDGKEGAADDCETRQTVCGANEKAADVCGSEALGFVAYFQKSILVDEMEAKPDEGSILSHSGPSMLEKNSRTLEEHIQYQGLDPVLDKVGADAKSRIEKGEVVHVSDNIVDQIHSKASSEYQSEEQEEKEISLTANKAENLKMSGSGPDYIHPTKSEVVTAFQDIHQSVGTNPPYDFKSELGHNYQYSEATILEQDMVESEPPRETDKMEITEQGNNSGKLPGSSETDLNLEDLHRSESNPVGLKKSESNVKDMQMLESNAVCRENMEPEHAQNQYISANSPTHVLKSKLKTDHEGVENDHFKRNEEEYYHSMCVSTVEVGETEKKENSQSFDKGLESNETDINVSEKQITRIVEFEAEKSQHISSHCNFGKLKPEETRNIEILETAQNEHNQAECSYTTVMDELKREDQEAKANALTYQSDGVSMLTSSNKILEEMQQHEQASYSEGQVEYQVGQSHESSFELPHHKSECDSGNNIKEREPKELDQVMEDHYKCIKMSVQESEQESKVSLPDFRRDGPFQSLATDSRMADERKQEIISALEDSIEHDFSHSENTVQKSLLRESEIKPRANAKVLEGNNQHTMKTRKGEHEKQEDETNELIMEGGNKLHISFTDEWNSKSEFPDQHFKMDSDSPRKKFEDPESRKLGHTETVELVPMDVDFEGQMEKKQKDECINQDVEPRQEPAKRQRRWNSGKNLLEAGNTRPLTTDTLKDIISQEAAEGFVASSSLHPLVSHPATSSSQSLSKAEKTSFSRPAPPPLKADPVSNGECQKPRIVPPSHRSPTSSLKVERFLRPFTVKALKELLSETGMVKYFWIDPIKTHCYVTYSSVEEAVATRNALYNLKWPIIGGRLLIAEFVEHEEAMSHGESQSAHLSNTRNSVPHKDITQGPSPLPPQGPSAQALRSPLQPDVKAKTTMMPKKDPEPEPAVYTLDDLFKKTRAKPHIYYLPLNKEQVAAKLAARIQDQQNRS
ncbi:uncharacterized protein LOC131048979 isoform X1 [Cryptomeria japonica]|uniref:uncharacterized protein LOC131048979 isoform X1 n=1 Tax=Cryptomeria japonica TaxID=3369 RepID=UPI0027DA66F7|nr:uncharacterized protein LOC131048979 isoform X1 [Cryptomeria japonica]XP_057838942.2 uncharacterized protein LOC131048979 isoform X1 [Cryptomeria japonica]XP_057838943.2 uncharacterized protein LOC131048979 isoform X1 [Cryptomeria japonica]